MSDPVLLHCHLKRMDGPVICSLYPVQHLRPSVDKAIKCIGSITDIRSENSLQSGFIKLPIGIIHTLRSQLPRNRSVGTSLGTSP